MQNAIFWPHFSLKDTSEVEIDQMDSLPPDLESLRNCMGSYYPTSSLRDSNLKKAIDSTVFLAEERHAHGGAGVVVNHEERKYLFTAAHVLPAKTTGYQGINNMFERVCGNIVKRAVGPMKIVYSSCDFSYLLRDLLILEYDGPLEGVPVQDTFHNPEMGFALGYPKSMSEHWKNSLDPLLSCGVYSRFKHKFETARPLDGREYDENFPKPNNLLYTGRIYAGNSGGGVFNKNGELIGIVASLFPLTHPNDFLYAQIGVASGILENM